MQETWIRSLSWEDLLEKGMATHFSILAWRVPWTIPWGHRVRHSWATSTFTTLIWHSNWTGCPAFYLPTPVSFQLYLEHPMMSLSQSASLFSFEEDSVKKSHHSHDHFPGIPCPTNHPTTSFDKMENGRESGCFKVLSQMLSYLILPSNPARYACVLVAQSCPTLWDSMDCSPPGSSVYGILLARILEWVAISSSRGSSQPRDQTHVYCVSCIGRQIHYHLSHQGILKDLL